MKKIIRLLTIICFCGLCLFGIVKVCATFTPDYTKTISNSYAYATLQFVTKEDAQAKMNEMADCKHITGYISEVEHLRNRYITFKINGQYYQFKSDTEFTDEVFIGKTALIIDMSANNEAKTAVIYIFNEGEV